MLIGFTAVSLGKSMKLLYLSCHEVLEHDELSLFHELGYEVFSPGAYVSNENKGDNGLRLAIPGLKDNRDLLDQWHQLAQTMPGVDPKYALSKEFVDNFDIVLVMHIPEWISNNWEAFGDKRVIWRTIGQSISHIEAKLKPYREKGMEIVRYSPNEVNIPGFIGQDALIRFYKDPEEYKGWTGDVSQIVTFAQAMKQRDQACNFSFFKDVTEPFPRKLYGPGNENTGDFAEGPVPHKVQKEILRESRAYFYTGTHPASYTLNFIEAWMTGCPIVSIGWEHGNASYFPNHDLYEVHQLITDSVNGFVSDDKNELRSNIHQLFKYPDLAAEISNKGRAEAIRHFGKDMIKASWKTYLEGNNG
jgi:glycosyltransferase involved in cell wall biosynthesis